MLQDDELGAVVVKQDSHIGPIRSLRDQARLTRQSPVRLHSGTVTNNVARAARWTVRNHREWCGGSNVCLIRPCSGLSAPRTMLAFRKRGVASLNALASSNVRRHDSEARTQSA